MKKYLLVFLLLVLVLLILPLTHIAVAHGLSQSLEKEINGYFIDVGYDALDAIEINNSIRFDFNLWEENRTDIADFNHVWVRISPSDRGISFAGYLYRPEFILTGMSYTFQKMGQYELTVRFLNKKDETLAEATFPLWVSGGDSERRMLLWILSSGIGGLAFGVVGSWLFRRKNE